MWKEVIDLYEMKSKHKTEEKSIDKGLNTRLLTDSMVTVNN